MALSRQHSSAANSLDGSAVSQQASPAGAAQSAFRVTDYSPEWDSTTGGAKLLLTGSLLPGAPMAAQRGPLYLLFDQMEVGRSFPDPVFRCHKPATNLQATNLPQTSRPCHDLVGQPLLVL